MVQQSTIHKVRIGDYAISRIEEIMPQIPLNILLPRLDPEFLDVHLGWLAPGHYDPETGLAPLSIHSWLLRTQHHTILVDACAGTDKPRVREEQAGGVGRRDGEGEHGWIVCLDITGTRRADDVTYATNDFLQR